MNALKILVICGVTALLASCSDKNVAVDAPRKVRTAVVTASGGSSMRYPGKVKASQDVSLAFRVSGTIARYYAEEGAAVSKGQLLVELDPTDYRVQLDATEAEYRRIKAEAERVMLLYEDSVATPNDYDNAVYGLQQITAKLQHHRDELAYTKLYAPYDGTLQSHLLEAHETVAAGTPVVSMVGGGAMEVEISIPAADYIHKESFANYRCTFGVYPGRVYELALVSVTPKANSNELYTMRLRVVTGDGPTPSPGMNAMVTIVRNDDATAAATATYDVPAGAVVDKNGDAYVFVYDAESGTVRRVDALMTAVHGDGSCTIQSESLHDGDIIVATGARYLDDGEAVSPLEEESSTNVGGLL